MADGPQTDYTQDKDFMAAPSSQQLAYLSHVDPDFAKAPPEQKLAYLNSITGKPAPTTAEQVNKIKPMGTWDYLKGEARGLGELAKGAAIGGAKTISDFGQALTGNPFAGQEAIKDVGGMLAPLNPLPWITHPVENAKLLSHGIQDPETFAQGIGTGAMTVAPFAKTILPPSLSAGLRTIPPRISGIASRVFRNPEGEISITPSSVLDRLVPQRPEVAAKEASAARNAQMEERAQSLMRRGEEQSKLDAAHEARLKDAETARQKELASQERLREQHARSINARKTEPESFGQGMTATNSPNLPVVPRLGPPRITGPEIRYVREFEKSPTVPSIGRGIRPSETERTATNLVRKPILSPEEYAQEQRLLGYKASLKEGEGLRSREARLLGTVRARRAARGMKEPQ